MTTETDDMLLRRAKFATKLCAAQGAVRNVPKSEVNKQQHYDFASTEAIFAMLRPILVQSGLAVIVNTVSLAIAQAVNDNGKTVETARVALDITLIDSETGYSETSRFEATGLDYGGDKAPVKAYTMAAKCWARISFMIDLQDDPDKETVAPVKKLAPVAPKTDRGNATPDTAPTPTSTYPDLSTRTAIDAAWKSWLDRADALGVEIKTRIIPPETPLDKAAHGVKILIDKVRDAERGVTMKAA